MPRHQATKVRMSLISVVEINDIPKDGCLHYWNGQEVKTTNKNDILRAFFNYYWQDLAKP